MSNDGLDKTVKFLAKREGIDKTLKLIRYASRLVAATTTKGSDVNQRFSALEKSIGMSRKAYRLGKFLQDVNSLRKSKASGPLYLLEFVAYSGEGVYYFIEQIVWLMKAGALPKELEARLGLVSAWAETLGYAAGVVLSLAKLSDLSRQEAALEEKLSKLLKEEGEVAPSCVLLAQELSSVRSAKVLRLALVVQDLADACISINDIRGGVDPVLSHPATLAIAGLISGAVSFHKNWLAT